MALKPHRVRSNSWKVWLTEGIGLAARKPLEFLLLGFGFIYSSYYSNIILQNQVLGLPVLTITLSIGVLIAYAADESKSVLSIIRELKSGAYKSIALILIIFLMAASLFSFVYQMIPSLALGLPEFVASITAPPTFKTPYFRANGLLFSSLLFYEIFLWGLLPLILCANFPLKKAYQQSTDSTLYINKVIIKVIIGLVVLTLLVGIFAPVLTVFIVILVSVMMYTSYRHIWKNNNKNKEKKMSSLAEPEASI